MKPSFWKPEDLRRSERIAVNLAAEVHNDWQQYCSARALNISQHGIGIEGSGQLLEVVFPNFNHQQGSSRAVFDVRLGLLEGASELSKPWVSLACHSAFVKRTGLDLFLVGMSFSSIDGESSDRLERYLRGLQELSTPPGVR